jgi:hypothetical protein
MAILLLSSTVQAAPSLTVEAARLDLRGHGDTTAALAGAAFQEKGCAGFTITGTAAHVHLEVDTAYNNLTVVVSVTPKPTTRTFDFQDAVITLSDPGEECRVLSWMDAGMAASMALPGGAVSLQPAPPDPTSYQPHTSGTRAKPTLGGPDLLLATADPGLAQVGGSLRLYAWDATLDVRSQNQTFHAALGTQESPFVPAVPSPYLVGTAVEQEAFLWLTDAHLVWTLPSGAQVLAAQARIDAPAGTAELHEALLPGHAPVPLLTIEAPRGVLHAGGGHLVGDFDAISTVTADGKAVSVAGARPPLWPLWACGVVLVSAVGGRRWALHGMRKAIDEDACERAARLALAVWPATAESRVARVVCLLRLGRLDAADRALRPRRWRSLQATRSFLQARLEATRGDAAAARRHLVECFLLAPAFVADARADLALHGIVEAALGRVHDLQPAREGYA